MIAKHGTHDQRTHGRRYGGGTWGSSHSGSYGMTGASARMLGLSDYRIHDDAELDRYAGGMLRGVRESKPRTRPLYHGERATAQRIAKFELGKEVTLPLTATSNQVGYVEGYATRRNSETSPKHSLILKFNPGTRALKYQAGEWVTAGRFRVLSVERGEDIKIFNYERQAWDHDPVTVVTLEPVEELSPLEKRRRRYRGHRMFNKQTKRSRARGRALDLIAGNLADPRLRGAVISMYRNQGLVNPRRVRKSLTVAQRRMVEGAPFVILASNGHALCKQGGQWFSVSKSGRKKIVSREVADKILAAKVRKSGQEFGDYIAKRFSPGQPRWPKGSGDKSGEWMDVGSPGFVDRVHHRALPKGVTPKGGGTPAKGATPRTWPREAKTGLYHYGESVTYPRTDRFGLDTGFLSPMERKKLSRPQVSRGATNVIPILEGKKHYKDPGEAVYRRSMDRRGKISNARLAEIYQEPSKATAEEIRQIGSAPSSRELDGVDQIKITTKGGPKTWERSYVIGQLRSRLQPSTAGTGRKIDPEKREKLNAKRTKTDKPSSTQMNAYRRQIADDWDTGKSGICVFCGNEVSVFEISVEKARPGQLGGKYSQRGNRWPACHTCNVQAGKQAQADPETYFEDSLRRFKRLPAKVRRKLKFVYEEFPELGRYPFKED